MTPLLLEYKLDLIAKALDVYRIETVTAVVRRQHTSEETGEAVDVIDFYPAWNEWGSYGKMKVAHEYLDHDWQRQRFEKHAGVSVDELPIYEGQQAMQRRFGITHKCEVEVRPFRLMLQPRKDENGNYDKTLILRFLPTDRTANQQPAVTEPPVPAVNGNGHREQQRPTQPAASAPAVNGNGRINGNGRYDQQPPPPASPRAGGEPVEFDDLTSATEQKFANTLLAKQPWFKSEESIITFRKVLFGEWDPKIEAAYWVGLLRYAEVRQAQQSHQAAKIEALNRYHRELKEKNHATSFAG